VNEREIYRIIDVNANRAREGLRVVEEVTRFILDEPQFTACLKDIRHHIAGALKGFPAAKLLCARNSREDVGRELYQREEMERDGCREIIRANMLRGQEALRTLEEFSKLIDPGAGKRFKNLRFRLYSLEKEMGRSLEIKDKVRDIRQWKLYVMLDRGLIGDRDPREISRAVVAAGVRVIQWRDKEGSDRETIKVIHQLMQCKALENIDVIINDKVDIALAAEADGVHLGQDDLPLSEVRNLLGEKIISISTHGVEEAIRAEKEGADYVALGPVFPTQTKKDAGSPLGVEKIREIKQAIRIPLVAVGGINETNIGEVAAAGADAVAVASAILKAKDITTATKDLLNKFKKTS
jgi:thiamine-phosphate pyrophosphorylase